MKKWLLLSALALVSAAGISAAHAEDSKFDIELQAMIANDNMTYGLTNTNRGPYGSISIKPTYGIFYGTFFAENLSYPTFYPEVGSQMKYGVGIAPEFGDLSFDINVQRQVKPSNSGFSRIVPYATATYAFNDRFSSSLGVGYYAYDDASLYPNTAELYGAVDVTATDWLSLHGEATYDFTGYYDGLGGTVPYLETIGSVTVTLPHGFSVTGKVAYEDYMSNPALASYTWYDAGVDYAFNEHVSLGLHYQGNSLGSIADCATQSWNGECEARVLASLTVNGKLSDLHK